MTEIYDQRESLHDVRQLTTSDIPEEIWATANALVPGTVSPYTAEQRRNYQALIARAIMAERETCARIAEMHEHQGVIAAAIRKQSLPNT